jgi:hypothetical protein
MDPVTANQLTRLLVPVLIVLGVGLVGIFVWMIVLSARARRNATPQVSAPTTEDSIGGAADFLTVKRSSGGSWEIEIEGRGYTRLDAVPDPDTRAEFMSAVRALAAFARNSTNQPATDRRRVRAPDATLRGTVPAASAASPSPIEPAVAEPPTRRVTEPEGRLPTIDFAHEIGDIVAEMMAATPSLQGHAVTLQNLPSGGITFAVDGAMYSEIDDIPNEEIREVIHRATEEWGRR